MSKKKKTKKALVETLTADILNPPKKPTKLEKKLWSILDKHGWEKTLATIGSITNLVVVEGESLGRGSAARNFYQPPVKRRRK